MMDTYYSITGYCAINNQKVMCDGELVFTGTENQPALFFAEVYKHFALSYPKFYKMDSLCKLGFLISERLLKDKPIMHRYAPESIGMVFQNAASSMDTDRNHQLSIQDRTAYFPSPSVFVYTLANIVIGEICIRHKIHGESTFFIEERFDAQRLHAYVRQLFDDGIVECCIAGWLEMDGSNYEGILYLIEKNTPDNRGIANFEPQKISEIFMQQR